MTTMMIFCLLKFEGYCLVDDVARIESYRKQFEDDGVWGVEVLSVHWVGAHIQGLLSHPPHASTHSASPRTFQPIPPLHSSARFVAPSGLSIRESREERRYNANIFSPCYVYASLTE